MTVVNTDELSNYYDFSHLLFRAIGEPELEEELFLSIADKPEPLQKTYIILVGLIDATLKDDIGEPLIIHFSEYAECEAKLFLDIVCELADDAIEMSLDIENPFMDIHVSCDAANQISGAIRDYYLCHHNR
ncbi:MAG: hypothetical protein NC127_03285 [Muribaculum sp.]|nr:hypothetical protein [Muribaculum sp.]